MGQVMSVRRPLGSGLDPQRASSMPGDGRLDRLEKALLSLRMGCGRPARPLFSPSAAGVLTVT